MNVDRFFIFAIEEFDAEMEIMRDKGREYTVHNADKLHNFKSIAERTGLKTEEVLLVYLLKHMDSIRNYIQEGVEASDEPIAGRIRDARNYLLLLRAIIDETNMGA